MIWSIKFIIMDKISGAVFKSVLAVCLTVLIIYFSSFFKDNSIRNDDFPKNFILKEYVPAKKIKGGYPPYPSASRENGEMGEVSLLVFISSLGEIESVSIEKTSGYLSLDNSTKKYVEENYFFEPAFLNSKPVRSLTHLNFYFKIQ